jgi:hypothetical protein
MLIHSGAINQLEFVPVLTILVLPAKDRYESPLLHRATIVTSADVFGRGVWD